MYWPSVFNLGRTYPLSWLLFAIMFIACSPHVTAPTGRFDASRGQLAQPEAGAGIDDERPRGHQTNNRSLQVTTVPMSGKICEEFATFDMSLSVSVSMDVYCFKGCTSPEYDGIDL